MRGLSLFDTAFIGLTFPRANLKGWWAADSLALSNGAAVSSLPDLSGNGFTFVQATGGNQPTFNTNQQNGKPGLTFAGSQFMTAGVPVTGQVFSMFAVLKNTSAASGVRGCFHVGENSGFSFNVNTGPVRNMQSRGAADMDDGAATLNTELWSGTRATGPTVWTFYLNGVSQSITSTNATMTSAATSSVLGKFDNALGGFAWVGSIFEVLVYDAVLSSTDRAKVEAYLNSKWAVF